MFKTDLEWIRENETKEILIDSEGQTDSTTLTKHENITDENIEEIIEKLDKRLDKIYKIMRECVENERKILTIAKEKGITLKSENDSKNEAIKQEINNILNSPSKR